MTIGDGGDEQRLVRLGPSAVVDAIGGVEGAELDDGAGGGVDVDDLDSAIPDDAEVLGARHHEPRLEEGTELDGVPAEPRLEDRHRSILGAAAEWEEGKRRRNSGEDQRR